MHSFIFRLLKSCNYLFQALVFPSYPLDNKLVSFLRHMEYKYNLGTLEVIKGSVQSSLHKVSD